MECIILEFCLNLCHKIVLFRATDDVTKCLRIENRRYAEFRDESVEICVT